MENLLPADITLDIFSRLPAESVLQCKQVCKTWQTVLRNPLFAVFHLHRSQQLDAVGILYLHGKQEGKQKRLYYGEHDENGEESLERLKRFNHPAVNIADHVIGSCNGLICFSLNVLCDINASVYICNPITKEYVNLPRFNNYDNLMRYLLQPMVHGFGYLPATNEYKVVMIFFHRDLNQLHLFKRVRSVQVYTLGGSSGWRNKGEIMFSPSGDCFHANGALYWLDDVTQKIVAFDLANEQFHMLPSLPFVVSDEDKFFLRVLGGLLCVVHGKSEESIDIWSFKKMNSSTYGIKDQEHQSWGWNRGFTISSDEVFLQNHDPFAVTKSGEILMWYDDSHHYPDNNRHSILFRYNPKTKGVDEFTTDFLFLEAIPHMNSFVMLKSLGVDVKFLGSAVKSIKRPQPPSWFRDEDEDEAQGADKKKRRCKTCGYTGHNRRTCWMA